MWSKLSMGRRVQAGFVLGAVIVLLIALFSYRGVIDLSSATEMVERSHKLIQQIDVLLLTYTDAESQGRGTS